MKLARAAVDSGRKELRVRVIGLWSPRHLETSRTLWPAATARGTKGDIEIENTIVVLVMGFESLRIGGMGYVWGL